MPGIDATLASKNQYRAALNRMLRGLAAAYKQTVLPSFKNHRNITNYNSLTNDADEWFNAIESIGDDLERETATIASQILANESARHTKAFLRAAQSSLKIDLRAVVRDEDLIEYLLDANSRNANLIKSLKNDAIKDIRRIVFDAKLDGRSFKKVANELADRFEISVRRAKLIAEDQTNKLNSDLNRVRQEQAGVKEYIWQTSADERVRSRHRAINGAKYKWGEPTGAEGGLQPGKPIRCRCTARAIVEF